MEIRENRRISGKVLSVGKTEIELFIDGFGPRELPNNPDMPIGFKRVNVVFTAVVPDYAMLCGARDLRWAYFKRVKFQG